MESQISPTYPGDSLFPRGRKLYLSQASPVNLFEIYQSEKSLYFPCGGVSEEVEEGWGIFHLLELCAPEGNTERQE